MMIMKIASIIIRISLILCIVVVAAAAAVAVPVLVAVTVPVAVAVAVAAAVAGSVVFCSQVLQALAIGPPVYKSSSQPISPGSNP